MINRLDVRSGVPLYLQIVDAMRDAILAGRVAAGERLPTVRETATRLRVNPGTVASAYDELAREGLIEGRVGAGTFVARGPRNVSGLVRNARERIERHLAAATAAADAAGVSRTELHRWMDRRLDRATAPSKRAAG